MTNGACCSAERVRLQLAAVSQYIDELEKDKRALIEILKGGTDGGLCRYCTHMPKPVQCHEAELDCALCRSSCKCKSCTVSHSNFEWKGRSE